MAISPAELFRDALTLPPEVRAALADSLLESLDAEIDPDAEDAWRTEIRRRLTDIDSGVVRMIPWDEARQVLQARLGR